MLHEDPAKRKPWSAESSALVHSTTITTLNYKSNIQKQKEKRTW